MSVAYTINVPQFEIQTSLKLYETNDKLDDVFERVVQQNPEMRVEQTSTGEIIIMPGTGGLTGNRNFKIIGRFYKWLEENDGFGFDSSTIFVLPNGAKRSPDLSWIASERWNALSAEQQAKYPPICPDFVVELRSRTDSLDDLRDKMTEYIENGAKLGWLIDPKEKNVHVYRSNAVTEILDKPDEMSGETLLPKLVLNLRDFW